MSRPTFPRQLLGPTVAFVVLDVLAVGAGMGVPIFAILLGFLVGWRVPAVLAFRAHDTRGLLRVSFSAAWLMAACTLVLMLAIWGQTARMLWGPADALANFGVPQILYEPLASFIGWLVLMIVISPVLQALAIFSAAATRIAWSAAFYPLPCSATETIATSSDSLPAV